MKHQHPWEIRMEHFGYSHIVLEWRGESIHFNPLEIVEENSIIVILGSWFEQLQGVRKMIRKKIPCTVVASQDVLSWLSQFGAVNGSVGLDRDGLQIELEAFEPIAALSPLEAVRKVRASLRHPLRIGRRLQKKQSLPSSAPQVAWIDFPSGVRLGHLNLCLHRNISTAFLEHIKKKAETATWILVGCDYEEEVSFLKLIEGFSHSKILLSDLVSAYRRRLGLPTRLLTPIADQLITKDLDIQVFPSKVGYRFDTIQLHNEENL